MGTLFSVILTDKNDRVMIRTGRFGNVVGVGSGIGMIRHHSLSQRVFAILLCNKVFLYAICWRLFPAVRSRFVQRVKETWWERVILSHKVNIFHPPYSYPVGRQYIR